MYLNRNHIYGFIMVIYKMKIKGEIADMLYCTLSNIAPSRPYDPDRLYETFFNVGEEREVGVLAELKDLINKAKVEDNLDSMWEFAYKEFVMGILWKGNNDPPENETLPKKKAKGRKETSRTQRYRFNKVESDNPPDDGYDRDEALSELHEWIEQVNEEQRVAAEMVVHPFIKDAIQSKTLSKLYEAFIQSIGEYEIIELTSSSISADDLVSLNKADGFLKSAKAIIGFLDEQLDDEHIEILNEQRKLKLYSKRLSGMLIDISEALKNYLDNSKTTFAKYSVFSDKIDYNRNEVLLLLKEIDSSNLLSEIQCIEKDIEIKKIK